MKIINLHLHGYLYDLPISKFQPQTIVQARANHFDALHKNLLHSISQLNHRRQLIGNRVCRLRPCPFLLESDDSAKGHLQHKLLRGCHAQES